LLIATRAISSCVHATAVWNKLELAALALGLHKAMFSLAGESVLLEFAGTENAEQACQHSISSNSPETDGQA